MFDTLKIKRSAAASLLICGMLVGGSGILGVQALLGTHNQARADERGDREKARIEEEHLWDKYKNNHPNAFEAAHILRDAEVALDKVKEYHGHRDAAIKHVIEARRELRAGVEGDAGR